MKNKIWKISGILICIGILLNILGFNINADATYIECPTETLLYRQNPDRYNNQFDAYFTTTSGDIRYTAIIDGTYTYLILVSLQNTSSYSRRFHNNLNNTDQNTTGTTNQTYTYNGVTFYVTENAIFTTDLLNIYTPTHTRNTSIGNRYQNAYYWTFGDGAEEPTPIVNWGELIISYRQNIYTEHPENNLDMITWNAYRDTAGNDLIGLNIEIQAIAGYFEGSSYADLKQTRFSDWLASTHPAVTMYKGTIETSHQEYDWGMVASNFRSINTLGTWFWNIFTNEGTWYQYGWRYQARLLDEDLEPLTEWQLIYTGNSYSPSATETLTDDEPLTPDDIDTINDINDENGTIVNWYINNTVITNNEYNQTYQQNIIENIYNILQGTPDDGLHNKAEDVQQTIDNAIDTEDDYLNDLQTQLNDIELNDITQNNGLMNALRWVREVHHETIETTVIGPIVLTIMLIGLITYLIGRRNG